MNKVIWTKRSLDDLKDIMEYISKGSKKYARITIEKIIDATVLLEKNPLIGRIVPEVNDSKFRELIKGNYRIIYLQNKHKVHILTVHHSARDLRKRDVFSFDEDSKL